ATSRAPLRLGWAHAFPIPPLPVPYRTLPNDAQSAAAYAGVAMFVERARAARPDFQLTDQNARVVAELCARLDGLPLALELAAARSDGLSPDGILDHLDLLSFDHGPRDLPARQRTLDAAIAWSYELLTETEQALLRRLAVFSRGWYLQAGEEVAEQARVLDGLIALIRGRLVQRRIGPDVEGRVGMLETIRAYALQQLEAAGEGDIFHRRHAEFFSTLIETSDWARTRPLVRTPDDGTDAAGQAREGLLGQVEEEEGNLRAGLGWAVEDGGGAEGLWLRA